MYKHFFKRFLDFWISLIALICISPILLVITIWLYFANKGAGALFLQERPGKNGKIFKVIKFKTMTDEWAEKESCWLIYNRLIVYWLFYGLHVKYSFKQILHNEEL